MCFHWHEQHTIPALLSAIPSAYSQDETQHDTFGIAAYAIPASPSAYNNNVAHLHKADKCINALPLDIMVARHDSCLGHCIMGVQGCLHLCSTNAMA